jgi:hypothetical protein
MLTFQAAAFRSSMPPTPNRETLVLRPATAVLTLTFVALATAAGPVGAQMSTTRGFNLGAHLSGGSLRPEGGDRSNAGGGGLHVGYGFNRSFQLLLQLDGAEFEVDETAVDGDWRMVHADLALRYHFANSLRRWVPYLQGGISLRRAHVDDAEIDRVSQTGRVRLIGGALLLGGGLLVYVGETLALEAQLAFAGGDYTEAEIDDVQYRLSQPYTARTARFNLGVSWWP